MVIKIKPLTLDVVVLAHANLMIHVPWPEVKHSRIHVISNKTYIDQLSYSFGMVMNMV